jgi:hypothetical protein
MTLLAFSNFFIATVQKLTSESKKAQDFYFNVGFILLLQGAGFGLLPSPLR